MLPFVRSSKSWRLQQVHTCDVTDGVADDADVALLKPTGSLLAKDKVGRSLDKTAGIQLVPNIAKNRILKSRKGTSIIPAISIRAQSHSLAPLAVGIRHVDIVQLKVGRLDTQGRALVVVGAVGLALLARDGDLVLSVAGGVRGVSVDGQLGFAGRNEDLLGVCALVDEDALTRG